MEAIRDLMVRLERDEWRDSHPFDATVNAANERLLSTDNVTAAEAVLNDWLARNQPCLFGRSAARQGLLAHCILFEADMLQTDEHIRSRVQEARTKWTRSGFRGEKSGFVITAISPRLTYAKPGPALKALAQRLCSLYLLEDIACDQVYMDDLFLEAPGYPGHIWRWKAGVNYFAANGDGRWWRDHRIPGGLAFSVNSVGHMARSGALAKLLNDGASVLGLDPQDLPAGPVDSLDKALLVAMQTIAGASKPASGPATWLQPLSSDAPATRRCPVHFPAKLQHFDRCEYQGFYHTDYTVPSEYFDDAEERPPHAQVRTLDFTYLSDTSVDNPAGTTMGTGQLIRDFSGQPVKGTVERPGATAELIELRLATRLTAALKAI